jgi:hypothetical protein
VKKRSLAGLHAGDDGSMSDSAISGSARFVGTIPNDHEIFRLLYSDELELYQVDPPLGGYRVIAAGRGMWAVRVASAADSDLPPEDPVRTTLFGTTGGESVQIVWQEKLLEVGGRAPARALAEAGYHVRR